MKKTLIILIILINSLGSLKAQDTLDYSLVDAFRIDKSLFSTKVLNYLIKKGEITKETIDKDRLNIFNYVIVIDIVDPKKLNDTGIYRFGILSSHGESYLLLKSNDKIEIMSDFEPDKIRQKVNLFLKANASELSEKNVKLYRAALEGWFKNRNY